MHATLPPRQPAPSYSWISLWLPFILPWSLVLLAWITLIAIQTTNISLLLNHDYLLRTSRLPWITSSLLFLLLWQVMFGAMMLPSSFSAITRLTTSTPSLWVLWGRQLAFLGGYTCVWTSFALLFFVGDTLLHWLTENYWGWLYERAWLPGTSTLLIASLFQLVPLKRRCLQICTGAHIQQLNVTAWHSGLRYGTACLGSCWAFMLVMMALGMQHLLWLAGLSAIMLIEKEVPGGARLRPLVGFVFLGTALLVLWWNISSWEPFTWFCALL